MSVPTTYLTIAREVTTEIEVKRSKFRCHLVRVETEEAARAVVEQARSEHWDARHHCSAFVLGPPPQPIVRSSDDGEPSGTAGAPMAEVLRGAAVHDVVAVVTRWFGGTLLGTGGLARAYADSVRAALAEAGTRRRLLMREHLLDLDHAEAGAVETALRGRGFRVLDVDYAQRVSLRVAVPPADEESLAALVASMTGGGTTPTTENWVDETS